VVSFVAATLQVEAAAAISISLEEFFPSIAARHAALLWATNTLAEGDDEGGGGGDLIDTPGSRRPLVTALLFALSSSAFTAAEVTAVGAASRWVGRLR
jgi:hypothetical protein